MAAKSQFRRVQFVRPTVQPIPPLQECFFRVRVHSGALHDIFFSSQPPLYEFTVIRLFPSPSSYHFSNGLSLNTYLWFSKIQLIFYCMIWLEFSAMQAYPINNSVIHTQISHVLLRHRMSEAKFPLSISPVNHLLHCRQHRLTFL